jgi:hypothetical protein
MVWEVNVTWMEFLTSVCRILYDTFWLLSSSSHASLGLKYGESSSLQHQFAGE